jgi:outer membrane protein TolC
MANAKFELFRDAKLQVCYDVQRTWYELFKIRKDIEVSQKSLEILGTIERLSIVKFQSASSPAGQTSAGNAAVNDRSQENSGTGRSSMQAMSGSTGLTPASDQMQQSPSMQGGSMGSSSGMSGLADIYRIQIEKGELQNNISMLINQHNTILARFNGYLNRPPETKVFVPESFISDTLSMPLLSVPDSIQANNPMLTMLDLERQSLDARKKMVKSMSYPMVSV